LFLGKTFLQKQQVAQTLRYQLSKPWLPLKCRKKGISTLDGGAAYVDQLTLKTQPFLSVPLDVSQPITSQLPDISQLIPSILLLNNEKKSSTPAEVNICIIVSSQFLIKFYIF